MATHDVEVMVATPPSGAVLVKVVGTALDVVMWPMVIVLRVAIGRVGSGSGSGSSVNTLLAKHSGNTCLNTMSDGTALAV